MNKITYLFEVTGLIYSIVKLKVEYSDGLSESFYFSNEEKSVFMHIG